MRYPFWKVLFFSLNSDAGRLSFYHAWLTECPEGETSTNALLDLSSAVLAIDCFWRIDCAARFAMSALFLRSWNSESLVGAGVEIELVTMFTSEARDLVLLEPPFPLRRARYFSTTFRTTYAHRIPPDDHKSKFGYLR